MRIAKVRPIIHVVGPSIAYVELKDGKFCLIEREDAVLVGDRNWTLHVRPPKGKKKARETVISGFKDSQTGRFRNIQMSRMLLDFPEGLFVDHKNTNTLDNRRANLRKANPNQNAHNCRISTRSTTGVKGVGWCARKNSFRVQVAANGTYRWVGYFPDIDSATAAYRQASIEMHGEFARPEG